MKNQKMIRYISIFLILIFFIFSSCDKGGEGIPNLNGVWESSSTGLKLTFRDGNFTARADYPSYGGSYYVYTGKYKLEENTIYLTADQVEWLDQAVMLGPKITKYDNPVAEVYKFKIKGETIEFEYANTLVHQVIINAKTIFAKRN